MEIVLIVIVFGLLLTLMWAQGQMEKLKGKLELKEGKDELLNEVEDRAEWRGMIEGAEVVIEKKDQCWVQGTFRGLRGGIVKVESGNGDIVTLYDYNIKTVTVKGRN